MARQRLEPARAPAGAHRGARRILPPVLEPPQPARHGRLGRRRRGPAVCSLPSPGCDACRRRGRALCARRPQHRLAGAGDERERRVRRLQPLGARSSRRWSPSSSRPPASRSSTSPTCPCARRSTPVTDPYCPVVLPSPRAAALVLDRMAWYGAYRRRHAAGPDRRQRLKDDSWRNGSDSRARQGRGAELEIMSGNEAIARGAWEAGVRFASAYPGTPSTEILRGPSSSTRTSTASGRPTRRWRSRLATGASLAGARALATMKHVGLNVAADPFFSSSHIGVQGRLGHRLGRRPRDAQLAG